MQTEPKEELKAEPKAELELRPLGETDCELLLSLLARMVTRGEKNPLIRNAQRLQFIKNMKSMGTNPDVHLGAVLYALETRPNAFSFESGLHMGILLALCARGGEGERQLKLMLADLVNIQEGEPEKKENKNV